MPLPLHAKAFLFSLKLKDLSKIAGWVGPTKKDMGKGSSSLKRKMHFEEHNTMESPKRLFFLYYAIFLVKQIEMTRKIKS